MSWGIIRGRWCWIRGLCGWGWFGCDAVAVRLSITNGGWGRLWSAFSIAVFRFRRCEGCASKGWLPWLESPFYQQRVLRFSKLSLFYVRRSQSIAFISSLVVLFMNGSSNINNKLTFMVSIILFLLFISSTNVDYFFGFSYLFYSIFDCFILLLNELKNRYI